jgi:threonine dehydratase
MYEKVLAAAKRLEGVAHRTPVLTSRTMNTIAGNDVFLKCENMQRMGAFKFRGAYNAISALSVVERERGVITYSSGNHAQAIALAGRELGVKTTVVVPADAPKVKLTAAKGYGADLVLYDRHKEDREQVTGDLIERFGYTLIPPFNHEQVIAGQGTAAKEFLEDVGGLDALLVQCGGGGLLSGCAAYVKHVSSGCEVIGVEPELADDATRSFHSRTLHCVANPQTIADGLRTASLGTITFPLIQQYVDDMITVSEDEIIRAMEFLWNRVKIIVEPSGAVSLAPLLAGKLAQRGKKVGVILSGGNVDVIEAAKLFCIIAPKQ